MMQAISGKHPTSVGRPPDAWLDWVGRIGLYTFLSTKSMVFLLMTLAIGGLLIQPNVSFLINRIQSEQLESDPTVVKKVIEGDQEVVMTTSIGYRVIMWRIGWQKWKERPFFGWGFTAILASFDFQIFKFAWRNYCVIWSALTYAVYLECLTFSNRGF